MRTNSKIGDKTIEQHLKDKKDAKGKGSTTKKANKKA